MKSHFVFFFFLLSLLSLPAAFAHCPICSAATGAMVAGARVVGVDDAFVGTFIGAFTISTAFWTDRLIRKRLKKQAPLQPYIISAIFIAVTVLGFYATGLLGAMPEFLWIFGMERLLFGIVTGSIVITAAFKFHRLMQKCNENRNYFPMQGTLMPVFLLLAADAFLYMAGVV